MTLEIGSLLKNRYHILEELGRGGMGAVYRAQDKTLNVDVAIKENLSASPEAERQFQREANLLAQLKHPNLPRVTDHFSIDGQGQYLVMDFVPGQDAKDYLEKANGQLDIAQVMEWGVALLGALNYLHSRTPPIIHRDIKPSNIKITPDGDAVLVDFGLAKAHDLTQTTTVGAKMLTPGFAPPEQYDLESSRTDPRTDLYSLGATLYNLLCGQMPVDSLERMMHRKDLKPLRELRPELAAPLASAIERALALKPDERWQTAKDFREALKLASAMNTKPLTPPEPEKPTSEVEKHPQPSRWPILGGGLLALAVAGGGLWYAFNSGAFTPAATPTVPVAATVTNSPSPRPSNTLAPTRAPTRTQPTSGAATPMPPTATTVPPTLGPTPRGGGVTGQIAFASNREGAYQIFMMNVDGSGLTRLTNLPDGACQPAWSPEGQALLFVTPCSRDKQFYDGAALWKLELNTLAVSPFISRAGGVFDADWSEAGIVFTSLDNANDPRLYTANATGGGIKRVSASLADDSNASWSNNNQRLVLFNTSRTGTPLLYWLNGDGTFSGSSPKQVTRTQAITDPAPAWSPTGTLIAFVIGANIFTIEADAAGFNEVQLTAKGPNADPAWSPDGNWLAFESWRDNANHEIYIMASNGNLQTRLTSEAAIDMHPAWRP